MTLFHTKKRKTYTFALENSGNWGYTQTAMKRSAWTELEDWKARAGRKPLLLRGARQVGKTWLMREFGRQKYDKVVVVNFDTNTTMHRLFTQEKDVRQLLNGMEMESGVRITPGDTLIILDEIQECPQALATLKYFCEDAPEYHVMAAGSLLGVAEAHCGYSFPVGKVEFLQITPLSFYEFLEGTGQERYADALRECNVSLISAARETYTRLLKTYFYVGGMPAAVADYAANADFGRVRRIQEDLLQAYEQDFAKHIHAADTPKVRLIWNSIPTQLAKEKKFIYNRLAPGARSSTYENALSWLLAAGLVHRLPRISKPDRPLAGYEDAAAFKLFMADIGLLCAKSGLDARTLLEGNAIFEEYKGALTEQYVLQELKTLGRIPLCYWTGGVSEVDFVAQLEGCVVPIEAKAGINLKAKSLTVYRQKYAPPVAIRTSLVEYSAKNGLLDIPLYLLGSLPRILTEYAD